MKMITLSILLAVVSCPTLFAQPDTCSRSTTLEASVDQVYDSTFYNWYFEGEMINERTPAIEAHESGEYAVEITGFINGDAWVTQQTFVVLMPVVEIEEVQIDPASCSERNGSLRIIVNSETGLLYSINGKDFQTENFFENLAAGSYTVTVQDSVTFTDEAGCTVEATINVPASECPMYVPNAFSPNDDGINDLFQIEARSGFAAKINTYLIFDRWGKLLYEAHHFPINSPDQWWDGTSGNKKAGMGAYLYLIEVEFDNGRTERLRGAVNLVH